MVLLQSVTRFVEFWKFLVTNFLTKVAQIFGNLGGYFGNHDFLMKNYCWLFWDNFLKILGYFLTQDLVTLPYVVRRKRVKTTDLDFRQGLEFGHQLEKVVWPF